MNTSFLRGRASGGFLNVKFLAILSLVFGASFIGFSQHASAIALVPTGIPASFQSSIATYDTSAASACITANRDYQTIDWLSSSASSNTSSVTVAYGSTANIPLQYNALAFLCHVITNTSSAGTKFGNLPAPLPDDRKPTGAAALTQQGEYIQSVSVLSGGGTIVASPAGNTIVKNKNTTTRYWFAAPVQVVYKPPAGGFTASTTVMVHVVERAYNNFGGTITCVQVGGVPNGNANAGYGCPLSPRDFPIQVNVVGKPDWTLQGNVSVPTVGGVPKTSVNPGTLVTFKQNVQNLVSSPSPATFAYGVRVQYDNGPVTNVPVANVIETNLAKGGKTVAYNSWGIIIPSTTTAHKLCVWITFTAATGPGTSPGNSSKTIGCVTINQPGGTTVSCDNANPPSGVSPGQAFSVPASVEYGSAAQATTAYNSGGRISIRVVGPSYDNTESAPTLVTVVSGVRLTGTGAFPAPTQTGTYTITYGVVGGTNPIADCPGGTFDVAYAPYFNILGGDATAGATFKNNDSPVGTDCTALDATQQAKAVFRGWNTDNNPAGTYNGAGAETGAFALGQISSFVTALANVNSPTLSPSSLSFANTTGVGTKLYGGNFGELPCVDDYVSTATGGSSWSTLTYDSPGYATYTSARDVHLSGGELTLRTHMTLQVTGNLYIDGNITYQDAGNIDNLPRLNVYVTGNIYVKGTVDTLHGFFVAQPKVDADGNTVAGTGKFATCYDWDGTAGSEYETTIYSKCQGTGTGTGTTLKVYGAVDAASIDLDRSFGSLGATDPSKAVPAEQFIYSPELWLSGSGTSGFSSGTVGSFDAITGLPPTL
jgi:hypothetical protein